HQHDPTKLNARDSSRAAYGGGDGDGDRGEQPLAAPRLMATADADDSVIDGQPVNASPPTEPARRQRTAPAKRSATEAKSPPTGGPPKPKKPRKAATPAATARSNQRKKAHRSNLEVIAS
ncbi:hypothetical protein KEM52_003889, partial [Ascosphaera acerosa]